MANTQNRTVFVPTENTVYAKLFYTFLAEGDLGVNAQHFSQSLVKEDGYISITPEALGRRGTMIDKALLEFVEASPTPLINANGSPIVKNGQWVFANAGWKNFEEKGKALERLAPGTLKRATEILTKTGFFRYPWPEALIIFEQHSEGWQFVSKEIRRENNGMQLGTDYKFIRKDSFLSRLFR